MGWNVQGELSIMMGFIKKNRRLATAAAAVSISASALAIGALISPTLAGFTDSSTATVNAVSGQWIVPAASLTATDGDFMNITVSWDAVPGYTNYTLQSISTRAGNGQWNSSNMSLTEYTVNGKTTYTLGNQPPGTSLAFRVRPNPTPSTVAGGWGTGQATGTVSFTWEPAKVGSGWQLYDSLAVYGDVSGDGRDDILAVNTTASIKTTKAGDIWVYTNDGSSTGILQGRTLLASGWNAPSYTKITGGKGVDKNKSGGVIYNDASVSPDKLYLQTNYDRGGWMGAPVQLGANGWKGLKNTIAVGDVNGDGNVDILTTNGTADYRTYLSNGSGALTAGILVAKNWSKYSALIACGDLNGDGRVDVLGVDSSAQGENVDFIPGINNSSTAYAYFNPAAAVKIPRMKVDSKDHFMGIGDANDDNIADFYETDLSGTGTRISGTTGYQLFWSGADIKRSLSTVTGVSGYYQGTKL